jgi:hypothetical protein
LMDFTCIDAFMSDWEIDELQAAVDKRSKARLCCVGNADVATPAEEPHAPETGLLHKCPEVVFSDVNSSRT